MKRLMIIDAMNQFLRAYIANPSLSANGDPVGGTVGFVKILQKLCREIKPDKIIICWDGSGGSRKRKTIKKDYKAGRKPLRLNRNVRNLTENQEIQNKVWQQLRLVEYLNNFPVTQLIFEEVEADDIISYVAQMGDFNDWQKVIVSADKDFYQLCDLRTVVFRPIQQEILNTTRIVDRHGVHPNNFALARAIAGDKSDNLAGVPGVGIPTIAKRFQFLAEEKTHTIEDILDACKSVEQPLNAHKNILENIEVIKINYKMMQLYVPSLSVQSRKKIKYIVRNGACEFNKTATNGMMLADSIAMYDWSSLFQTFKRIIVENKEKKN